MPIAAAGTITSPMSIRSPAANCARSPAKSPRVARLASSGASAVMIAHREQAVRELEER